MKKTRTIRVYNLVDSKGNRLRLELGVSSDPHDDYLLTSKDKGYRWRFIGKHIPMPVRSMCWFNGFPEPIMIDWLKGNGWYPHTCVDMCSGYAEVFELPNGNEYLIDAIGNKAVVCAIKCLWHNGKKIQAVHLYSDLYGCPIDKASVAVREIVDLKEKVNYN